MATPPKPLKHYVLVARPRIETAIVEVEATNDEDAEQEALAAAEGLPASAWKLQRFDPADYRPHVETMIAEDELGDHDKPDRERATQLLAEEETRYLLLRASGDGADGELLPQPWFITDEPDLLASDLTRDWLASLEQLGITYLPERLDDLAAGGTPTPADRILFRARSTRKRNE